jgi:hypothetical protein
VQGTLCRPTRCRRKSRESNSHLSRDVTALTNVGERISCSGKVVEKLVCDGERLVRVELTTRNAQGQIRLSSEALVALPILRNTAGVVRGCIAIERDGIR